MANVNSPFGLRAVRHQTGGVIRLAQYTIASEYNTAIYSGDVVELTGTGKNIAKAAAANADNLGVFAGVMYVDAQGNQVFSKYWPASTVATAIKAYVYDDPNIVFEAQFDVTDPLEEGDVGKLADWHVGTGSAATGVSGLYVDHDTLADTNAALKIIGLVPRVDNAYGAYAKVEVIFAEHVMARVVAGVGGI